MQKRVLVGGAGARNLRIEAHALVAHTVRNNLVQAHKGATTNEQNVSGVNLQKLLLRMLTATRRRHACNGTLKNLEECLLHALTRDIARNGEVFCLASNLVNLVHIDNAHLSTSNVAISSRNKLAQDVLDILTHVASLGQRCSIGNSKRYLKNARECLSKQRLAGTRRAKQQDIALRQLNVVYIVSSIGRMLTKRLLVNIYYRVAKSIGLAFQNAAIVVVDSHRHGALCIFLTHHIGRKLVVNLVRRGHTANKRRCRQLIGISLVLRLSLRLCLGIHRETLSLRQDILRQ